MGAWGTGIFDDDTALDFIYELEDAGDLSPVMRALEMYDQELADENYLEAPTCSSLLAGGEAVALVAGYAGDDLPEELTEWQTSAQPTLEGIDLPRLIAAIERVLTDSELQELWEESEEYEQWQEEVQGLLSRLRRITS